MGSIINLIVDVVFQNFVINNASQAHADKVDCAKFILIKLLITVSG